ncbi:MAG: short-chain dehydrogenase [Acidobacteria bacterium]|nr:MAG: short-chain dehydrogenase [Acidobacteriota bacterium]PYR17756.1 MAG: short-chain dehydrogenase [Acidobacteriota bacterium]PYR48467.1 MAG: short-chain dehydrogenase [Acidobacteriota bacterium]
MTSRTTEDSCTALITGASSGIGLELARTLAANGHSLVIVARDEARLKAVAAQLESDYGVPVTWHAKDLSEPRAADDLWSDLSKANIIIDVLVNNAGVGLYGDFQDESLDAVRRMQMINVVALTTLTRLALPGMLARHRGRILNVASMVGYQPGGPRMAVYYATKSYVLSFSKGIARELDGSGVSVTALCPGLTKSAFEEKSGAQETRLYRLVPQMTASAVAMAGYRAMMRGRRVVIPGVISKILAFAGELPPRTIALEVNRFLLNRAAW